MIDGGILFMHDDGVVGGYLRVREAEGEVTELRLKGSWNKRGVEAEALGFVLRAQKARNEKAPTLALRGEVITPDGEVLGISVFRNVKEGATYYGISPFEGRRAKLVAPF